MSSPPPPAELDRRGVLHVLAALALACCTKRGSAGRERVVSVSPSTTEAVFAIGAGSLLVGRSKYCDYPPEAARLPIVGGFADPSIEAILALSPTLVIGAHGLAGPALERSLTERGITPFFPETESLAQIEGMLTELGKKLDREPGAASVVASIESLRRQVAAAVAGLPKARAVFLFDVLPIFTAGPGSFPDELLREAGGVNVVDKGGAYPTLDLERLLALDPDVILDGSMDQLEVGGALRVASLRDARGWRDLRAIREGKVRGVPSMVLRPGPRIGVGLVAVARALHGETILPPQSSP